MFWDALPEYLAMGMSADEFWHGDLRLCKAYKKAYQIRLENIYVREWREGMYALRAFGAVMGGNDCSYPEEPLFSANYDELIESKEKRKMEQNKAHFMSFAARFNSSFDGE